MTMVMTQIAIANTDNPRKVVLWCDRNRRCKNGTVNFTVRNGAWSGSLRTDGTLMVGTGKSAKVSDYRGVIVWDGKAPYGRYRYCEAIAWIEEQIRNKEAEDESESW